MKYEKEIEDRQLVVREDHRLLLRLKYALGHIYVTLDIWERVESLFKMVLESTRRILGANAVTTLICEAKVVSWFIKQGELVRVEHM